jgi:glycosyltransferase involved in cell wall biosynthesis
MALDISIIVPLYNEQAVFDNLIERLVKVIDGYSKKI